MESLELRKFGSLEMYNKGFGSLAVWHLELLRVWKFGRLEVWQFGSLEVWKFGILEVRFSYQFTTLSDVVEAGPGRTRSRTRPCAHGNISIDGADPGGPGGRTRSFCAWIWDFGCIHLDYSILLLKSGECRQRGRRPNTLPEF